jgi:antitoxin (DNA-binding transcriptional repressor) of toxin-antitoxin stability system
MKQIDLDDVPPKVAQVLADLQEGEELALVRHGAVLARLAVQTRAPTVAEGDLAEAQPEERMKEVMEHFNAMIHDEF